MEKGKTDLPQHHLVSTYPGLVHNHCFLADMQACILNCLMSFDSKRLESVKLQMAGCSQLQTVSAEAWGNNQRALKAAGEKLCDNTPKFSRPTASLKNEKQRTSLVVQRFRTCLLMQGIQIQSLVQELRPPHATGQLSP